MEADEVEELFVMPSAGDESCAIGAAIWAYARAGGENEAPVRGVGDLYWGPGFSGDDADTAVRPHADKLECRRSDDIEAESAALLAEHKIIGRLSGRMEWGARALGNRSILANPSRPQNLRKLNAAIKMRDFWMPFAPSILQERRADYAVLAKGFASFHMTMAYDSTPLAREQLIAALHPYDFTMRPQFVAAEHNPRYHRLIREFEKLTGIGGVLNTSFNLHGWPIVCSPEDAVWTLLNSDLDYVTIEDRLVRKKASAGPDAD
jgi:carbamoyltransferase